MSSTPATDRSYLESTCTPRDPRVVVAVEGAMIDAFAPLEEGWRELSVDAMVRLLEDLQVYDGARVLVVEPFSANLPVLLARLANEVVVVCSQPERAERLRKELREAAVDNAVVHAFLQDREHEHEPGFDRIVVMQPANERLGPVLAGQLAVHGRAVWALDRACPPRRVRRLLRLDEAATLEEDLDLVHYMPLLGDMLVDAGVALRQEVAEAVVAAEQSGRRLGEELLARGAVREQDLFRVLAAQRELPFTNAGKLLPRLDTDLVASLPRTYLRHYRFLPVRRGAGELLVATSDVDLPLSELRAVFDEDDVKAELLTPSDLDRVWAAIDLGLAGAMRAVTVAADEVEVGARRAIVSDSEASTLLDEVLTDALEQLASEVHFESRPGGVRLRFRVHGCLRDVDRHTISKHDLTAMLEVMARLAVGDDEDHDASWALRWPSGGRELGLLVGRQQTVDGVAAVVRLMNVTASPRTITELGFDAPIVDAWHRELRASRGMVLVCGPLRSGRTATAYAALRRLVHDPARKVVAIEDAPSFALAGIQQVAAPVSATADAVDVAAQQAADVLMVGELHDAATVQAALRAVRSGHLVLAGMHANDGIDALQQLVDHGLSHHAIATSVNAVFVQLLARRNCAQCRQPVELSFAQREALFGDDAPNQLVTEAGKGCEACRGTGFDGVVPIVEYLPMSPPTRRALRRGMAPHDLGSIADGGCTMRDSALALLRAGAISFDELRHVLSEEQLELVEGYRSPAGRCS